jgi:shikimate 5-dehydrogenase
MKRYAILGHPVSHSRSPEFHNAVFQSLGLEDYRYEFCDTTPEDLEQLMQAFRVGEYAGFSVTIPHKQTVMRYCDEMSERAEKVGAVNTLLLKGPRDKVQGPKGIIFGDNTDYLGFEKCLLEANELKDEDDPSFAEASEDSGGRLRFKALVLGAGGAAKAIVAVLLDHGCEVVVASRRKEGKFSEFSNFQNVEVKNYKELDPNDDWSMIVNTTPIGMESSKGQGPRSNQNSVSNNQQSSIDQDDLLLQDARWYTADRTYVDIVYTPKMTPFLLRAEEDGGKIVTGDRMFFWQAVEQAKMFSGASEEEILKILNDS